MMRIVALIVGLAFLATAPAMATTYTLGEQDYADGTIVDLSSWTASAVGEAAPFDRFYGSDGGPSFNKSFAFSYIPGSFSSASLTIGIYDNDSAAAGNQVAYFGLNGVDLTSTLNALFESHTGLQQQSNVYSLALSGSALAALSSGNAAFSLTLSGPSTTGFAFNGAGLDFASLTVDAAAVPEPATWAMMIAGFGMIGATMRRRSHMRDFAL